MGVINFFLGLTTIFSNLFYTKIAPKNPERLMSEVCEAKVVNGNRFRIVFSNGLNKMKVIEYEASDPKTAAKIVAKIQYIK